MKKKLIIIFVCCLLFALALTYTKAEAEEGLVGWYKQTILNIKDNISNMSLINSKLEDEHRAKLEAAVKESKEKLNVAVELAMADNNQNIENYQLAYLKRLTAIREELKRNSLTAYTEKKENEISAEISQEISEYLAEILEE